MSDLQIERYSPPSPTFSDFQACILRLDLPRRRNALTPETVDHLLTVLNEYPSEVLVLGSSTPGIFCAGADLAVDDTVRARLSDRLYACYELMVTRPGVVLVVVEGAAVGGGAQLCAAADLRIASPDARWRWAGPGHGLAVGSWVLPELVGRSRALDLTMSGRWLTSEEAASSGFARISSDPWQETAAVLDALAVAEPTALARLKQVTSRGPLLERLREERESNFLAWSGSAPSPRDAARHGRRDNE